MSSKDDLNNVHQKPPEKGNTRNKAPAEPDPFIGADEFPVENLQATRGVHGVPQDESKTKEKGKPAQFGADEASVEDGSSVRTQDRPNTPTPSQGTSEETIELDGSVASLQSFDPLKFEDEEHGYRGHLVCSVPGAWSEGGRSAPISNSDDDVDTFLMGGDDGVHEEPVANPSFNVMARLVEDSVLVAEVGADRTKELELRLDHSDRNRRKQLWIGAGFGVTIVALFVPILSYLMVKTGVGNGDGRGANSSPSPTMTPTASAPISIFPQSSLPTTASTSNARTMAPSTKLATPVPSSSPQHLTTDAAPTPQSSQDATNWINLIKSKMPSTVFDDTASPQRRALDWMMKDDFTIALDNVNRIIQRFALASLYYSTNGPTTWYPSMQNRGGWLLSSTECDWAGVGCSKGVVVSVKLFQDGLSGSLPPEIGLLKYMTSLHISENHFLEGTVPSEIGLMTSLSFLLLYDDNLHGTLPSEIGLLESLAHVSLYRNFFEGTIPSTLGLLTHLTWLSLETNELQGTIPSEIGLMNSLTSLSFWANHLEGTIPSELGLMTPLAVLSLGRNNNLSGRLPTGLGNLLDLRELYLPRTNLSGSIPSDLCGNLRRAQIECGKIQCDCCTNWDQVPC